MEFMKKLFWTENLRFRNFCLPPGRFAPPGNFPSYATGGFPLQPSRIFWHCSHRPVLWVLLARLDLSKHKLPVGLIWQGGLSMLAFIKINLVSINCEINCLLFACNNKNRAESKVLHVTKFSTESSTLEQLTCIFGQYKKKKQKEKQMRYINYKIVTVKEILSPFSFCYSASLC